MEKKNKQKIVITDKELTPTIIGKMDTKEKSPILLIVIFIIFIAVAFFMPDITNYVNNYLSGSSNKTNIIIKPNNDKNNSETTNKNDEEETLYYDYSSQLSITYDNFSVSNFSLSDTQIFFDVKNNTNEILDLTKNKYFLELYNNEFTLVQRIKISYGLIESNGVVGYSYDLDSNVKDNLSKLMLVSKNEQDYPEVTLDVDSENNEVLTCTKGYETIKYTFINNSLIKINDVVNYPADAPTDYLSHQQYYQMLAATYNNYEGVSSTIITTETGFTFTSLIDLQNLDITNLENNNYYKYKTEAKTVKFETESNGFSCN